MPEVEYSTHIDLPPDTIWEFVKDMNNWAPFLTGYQKHEIIDDTDSIWWLKGDVGVLSRMVELKAHVTEWMGPEKVSFTLTGVNEAVEGAGRLVMVQEQVSSDDTTPSPPPKKSFLDLIFGFLFRLFNKNTSDRKEIDAPSLSGGLGSRLTFTLSMEAGGATAPLVNAMLGPAMKPAAEDLANKIAAHLEQQHKKS
jgi:carbon monoxide dehydrogenase subunit G